MGVSFPNNSVFSEHKTQEKAAAQTQLSADPVKEWILKETSVLNVSFSIFQRHLPPLTSSLIFCSFMGISVTQLL
jgi:hypothetical protein